MRDVQAVRIRRFGRTARALHWLTAACFGVLLATGLALYLPSLSALMDRPTAKHWHLVSAVVLGLGIVAIVLLGDRRAVAADVREIDRFDRDDRDWLLGGAGRARSGRPAPPQGRFNAGQKLNAVVSLALLVVLAVTGTLLWLGEQDTTYRFAGSVTIHDLATLLVTVLVCGHIYMAAFNPATRHALRGMVQGDVDRAWASRHHAKWVDRNP